MELASLLNEVDLDFSYVSYIVNDSGSVTRVPVSLFCSPPKNWVTVVVVAVVVTIVVARWNFFFEWVHT